MALIALDHLVYEPIVRAALLEDIGSGDITTNLCIPADARASATILAKAPGVVAGLDTAAAAFRLLDPNVHWTSHAQDGHAFSERRTELATVVGTARALLTAERVALNFLQRMSGISTLTASYVEAVLGTSALVTDTRKTTPGLRVLEKYAVRAGGGSSHRFGLSDCVLIKDNHILAAGGIAQAVSAAKRGASHTMKVEVETDTLEQVREAVDCGADIVLLDNMSCSELIEAVQWINHRAITEASGGITLATAAEIAATGVDLLSVGALTHSAPSLDISLDFTS